MPSYFLFSTDPVLYTLDENAYTLNPGVPVTAGHDSAAGLPDGESITLVRLYYRMKDPDGNGDTVRAGFRIGGVDYWGSPQSLDAPGWFDFTEDFAVNPATGTVWTRASIDTALAAGICDSAQAPSDPLWTFFSMEVFTVAEDRPGLANLRSATPAPGLSTPSPKGSSSNITPRGTLGVPNVP